jgi:hypothetical protein
MSSIGSVKVAAGNGEVWVVRKGKEVPYVDVDHARGKECSYEEWG